MGKDSKYPKYRWSVFLIFALIVCITSCFKNTENKIDYDFAEPYEKSFWNKNIKFIIKKTSVGDNDTIKFDESGNITEEQSSGRPYIRRLFDRKHRVIRMLDIGEFENLLITYDSGADWMMQNRLRIMSAKWSMDSLEIDHRRSRKSIYIFGDDKNLKTQFAFSEEVIKEYTFEDDKMVEETITLMKDRYKTNYIRFHYDKSNIILRMEEYFIGHSVPDRILFFNDGRLDSLYKFKADRTPLLTTFQYFYN